MKLDQATKGDRVVLQQTIDVDGGHVAGTAYKVLGTQGTCFRLSRVGDDAKRVVAPEHLALEPLVKVTYTLERRRARSWQDSRTVPESDVAALVEKLEGMGARDVVAHAIGTSASVAASRKAATELGALVEVLRMRLELGPTEERDWKTIAVQAAELARRARAEVRRAAAEEADAAELVRRS